MAQPGGDAVAADACRHAQVQGAHRVGGRGQRGCLESLWLHRPYHQGGIGQKCTCLRVGLHAKAGLQLVAGLVKRLHHVNLFRGQALFDQAADDGAGHVASADECDAFAHLFPVQRSHKT